MPKYSLNARSNKHGSESTISGYKQQVKKNDPLRDFQERIDALINSINGALTLEPVRR